MPGKGLQGETQTRDLARELNRRRREVLQAAVDGREPAVNPLTPNNDQHLISPYNFTPKSHMKVTRNEGNDYQRKKLSIVKQILLVSTLGNVLRTE